MGRSVPWRGAGSEGGGVAGASGEGVKARRGSTVRKADTEGHRL